MIELYNKASKQGHNKSIKKLIYCYQYGIGVEKNYLKMLELYIKYNLIDDITILKSDILFLQFLESDDKCIKLLTNIYEKTDNQNLLFFINKNFNDKNYTNKKLD